MDFLDITDPPQLCGQDLCGRPMDVAYAAAEGHHLVLICPVHGEQGMIDPFAR